MTRACAMRAAAVAAAVAAIVASIVASASAAHAAPAPRGILVVLHGDDLDARATAPDWAAAAAAAHLVLIAPDCPRDLRCDNSWWKWALTPDHDPTWLEKRIAAAEAQYHVDGEHVYLAGYSGGASYLASWAPAHAAMYGRVAYVSGGYLASDACPSAPLRALVEIGSEDDMRADVDEFAKWLASCPRATVETRIAQRIGHHDMHGALKAKLAKDVIGWLVGE